MHGLVPVKNTQKDTVQKAIVWLPKVLHPPNFEAYSKALKTNNVIKNIRI